MEAGHVPILTEESSLSVPRIQANPWIVLIVLALGEFMILLDTTIVAVAVPSLGTDLKAGLDEILWILNAYTLVFAVLLITAGRLGDMWGPKRMFLIGLGIFTLSSLACGLSQSPTQLIIFRIFQAVGGAALMPQTLSIVTSIFPPERRGAAFGAWSAVAGLAAVAGPTLGGLLTSAFSWRAVFFPNVPIGIVAIVLAALMMPEMTVHRKRQLDVIGVVLATAGLVALVYAVIEGANYNWGRISDLAAFDIGGVHAGLVSIPSIFLLSAILLIIFVVWESRQEEPLLPLSLFHDLNYSLGSVVSMIVNFAILGFFFPMTLFLQSVLGFSALKAGLTLLPNALAIVVTAPLAGRLSDRFNPKYILAFGLVLFAIGLYVVGRVSSLDATSSTYTFPVLFIGAGMGLTFAPMTSVAMRNIVPTAAGAASGFLNTIRQVGAAIGSAVTGAVLADQLATNMAIQAKHYSLQLPTQYRSGFLTSISNFSSSGLEVGAGNVQFTLPPNVPANVAHQLQTLGQTVYKTAFLDALIPSLYISIPLMLFAAGISLLMRSPKKAAVLEPGVVPEPVLEPTYIAAPLNVQGVALTSIALPRRLMKTPLQPIRSPHLARVGAEGGTAYEIPEGALSIGRIPSSTVVLDSPKVSRNHAQVSRHDGRSVVRDLNSVNGTYVNGERVQDERVLHDGDVIGVGDDAFIFRNDLEQAHSRLVSVDEHGAEYPIGTTVTVGRHPDCEIVLNNPSVSRRHAELWLENGSIVVRDLETLNGTYVNGEAVAGDWPLSSGDIVSFGSVPFIYRNDFDRP